MISDLVEKVKRKENLSKEETINAFDEIMSGKIRTDELADFLQALAEKGEVIDELLGAVCSMKKVVAKVEPVIDGELLDIVVDLRLDSPTWGKYITRTLSEENKNLLYIPKGCGHAFAALSEYAELVYKVDNDYSLENESGIKWDDPTLNISWPFTNPKTSEKDKHWPSLEKALEKKLLF